MNLVKQLTGRIIALLAIVGLCAVTLTACSGDDNDAIAPDFPKFAGQTWCVYPEGAQQACADALDENDKPIPQDHWKQATEPTRSYDANGNYDNDMDIFFWLWLMGHMNYYGGSNFINHYHMDSGYTSRVSGYQTKYRSTIDTVSSSSKYSNYKDKSGKSYTGKEVETKPGLKDRLSNDRKNKPLQCSAGEISSRVDFVNVVQVPTKGPGGGGKSGGGKSGGGKTGSSKTGSGSNKPSSGKSGSNNKPTKPSKSKNPC